MTLLVPGSLFAAISFVCALLLLRHAFRRSVGTGMMVLLIPCYILFYAFSQFEHPRKGLIVSGLLAGTGLAAVFLGMGAQAVLPPSWPPPAGAGF